ncbi:hypothetical protein [Lactobacillus apis]|uniref:Putative bacteriocin transport accessory protein n=1 Tax=Lactobacillus apis TaxID=303541 RepID=A0A0F4LWE4_9LACO|nr:hypothetical protein [Lactobacillus apis]KJY62688.1 putative bacteriocin transport accessory protein [Lactobacillus apis]
MEKNKKIIYGILIVLGMVALLTFSYLITQKSGGGTGEYNDKTSQFIHRNPTVTINKLEKREKGIYYFGFPTCPWCQELLPVFDSSLKTNKLKSFVVNTRGSNYSSKENIKLETFFIHHISEKKRLTVPLIIMIKNKKDIRTHIGTVPGHNAEFTKMNLSQKKKLLAELNDMCKWYSK